MRLLLRREATIGAELNMLCQRRDEVKMLKRLRMMNEIERRAALYVSITGTHSDLYLVTVVVFLRKSASFRLMFFARLI